MPLSIKGQLIKHSIVFVAVRCLCVCLTDKLGYLLLILHTILFRVKSPVEFLNRGLVKTSTQRTLRMEEACVISSFLTPVVVEPTDSQVLGTFHLVGAVAGF